LQRTVYFNKLITACFPVILGGLNSNRLDYFIGFVHFIVSIRNYAYLFVLC